MLILSLPLLLHFQLYDYPKIVTKPMDLGTIKNKLNEAKYSDAAECADDVRLVWKNCMTYNADGSDFYRLAESYSKRFEERYQKLIDEFGEDVICGNVTEQSAAKPLGKKSRSNSFASSGRNTPAPDNNNGEKGASSSGADKATTFDASGIVPLDVKTRFAARLQRLSGMELGHVLQVIDMECPEALEDPTPEQMRLDAPPPVKRHRYAWDEFDGGCQIEVDVDAIPPEIFWTLDEYVKEKVAGRGRGPWSDDLTETGEPGVKKRKVKSI